MTNSLTEDKMTKEKVIFFGNGPLANYALAVIERDCQVIFHARTKEDLEEVKKLKKENPEAHGVLASFGVIIRSDVLDLFEPEGILNIHPSLLPRYRGASPIESAILAGEDEFGVSVMKLVPKMDAGPIYIQATLSGLPIEKDRIYRELAETGAKMVLTVLWRKKYKEPVPQNDAKATYCGKLDKAMGLLTPETDTAEQTLRKIIAFQAFPKPKYAFWGKKCIILEAHILESGGTAVLTLPCADGRAVAIDILQPEGRKAMDAVSFINGYKK
jgi:methionyl-tRNA formyltransferase